MLHSNRVAKGWLFWTGIFSACAAPAACTEHFPDCRASRSCAADGGEAGDGDSHPGSVAGKGGKSGAAGKAGELGNAGKSGSGGNAGEPDQNGDDLSESGAGGEPTLPPPSAGRGGAGTSTSGGFGGEVSESGGEGGAEAQGSAGSPAEADHEPPHVLMVTPPEGATGVEADVKIVIDFDEAMDTATTEAAFSSADIPEADLYWRNYDRELVIIPKTPLVYADVTDLAADAKSYAFTIHRTAQDSSGNELGIDLNYQFKTLRHITHSLPVAPDGGRLIIHPQAGMDTFEKHCPGGARNDHDKIALGDSFGDDAYAGLISFDLSSIPDGVVEWKSMRLNASVALYSALNPFRYLGDLLYEGVVVEPDLATWSMPVEVDYGEFSNSINKTERSVNVKQSVPADYAARVARSNRSQYFVHFADATDGDHHNAYVGLPCNSLFLALEYIAP